MKIKYRICRRYAPITGTWYVIQKKILWWWHTYKINFNKLSEANNVMIDMLNGDNINDEICETPLIYKNGKYVEEYPCKTNCIKN